MGRSNQPPLPLLTERLHLIAGDYPPCNRTAAISSTSVNACNPTRVHMSGALTARLVAPPPDMDIKPNSNVRPVAPSARMITISNGSIVYPREYVNVTKSITYA